MYLLLIFLNSFLAFAHEEIKIPIDKSFIFGTLENGINEHLIIQIAGSGPTDRNGNSKILQGENNSLKYLAEELTLKGFSTFRFDKRMIGDSDGFPSEDSTIFYDFVTDVNKIVSFFRENYKFEKISIIGHSEGSLIGAIATSESNVNKFVSLCGMVEPLDTTLIKQLTPKAPAMMPKIEKYLDDLNAGRMIDSVHPLLLSIFRPSVQPYLIDILKYNPDEVYTKIVNKTLFIGGGYDIQVKGEDIVTFAKSINGKYLIFEEMNHVLKKTPKDYMNQIESYSNPDLPLYDGLINEIVKFLNE